MTRNIPFHTPPSQNQPGWLVSFGDLLTLLLCFFLSIASGGALHSQDEREKESLISGIYVESSKKEESPVQSVDAGTQLAFQSLRQDLKIDENAVFKLGFRADAFSPNGVNLLLNGRKLLETITGAIPDSRYQIAISTCSRRTFETEEETFELATMRALSLKRQLIDGTLRGVDKAEVHYRNVGSRCDELLGQEPDGSLEAVIELRTLL